MAREDMYLQWKKRMEDFKASGQTVKQWLSTQEGITIHQFHYWRRKLKNKNEIYPAKKGWTSFEVPALPSSTTIEMKLDEVTLYIPENVSEDHLHRVIRVLRRG
ncbi:hypothetical protein K8O68_15425 [Salipaludibacillus sp. CUR1]|uniref:IS66 family insertion sequence element accessory protein TnpA n=1 Tax=Salipaludibacillus sp. CUR1 TaxID=2820003 RepID=UPI001E648D46|nr:hypothetical protein [Salipaludibacillus sp. CUR1]MCE7793812.1 hypothetical protein [Salipaludibacillus sp. CUR1]